MGNTVITINRMYGSGGRTIGGMLSEQLNIAYYDKDLITMASEDSGISVQLFGKADETVKHSLFKKSAVYNHDLLPPDNSDFVSNDNLFNIQAKVIKELAANTPCVIVGRCADYILKDYKNVIKVFIYADEQACIDNVVRLYGVSEKEAKKTIEKTDKRGSEYYKYYTGNVWDNARNYDLCLDTGRLGFDKCVEIIKQYIIIKNA